MKNNLVFLGTPKKGVKYLKIIKSLSNSASSEPAQRACITGCPDGRTLSNSASSEPAQRACITGCPDGRKISILKGFPCYHVYFKTGSPPKVQKLHPGLKNLTAEVAIEMGDVFISFGPVTADIKALIGDKKLITIQQWLKENPIPEKDKAVCRMTVNRGQLEDVIDALKKLRTMGYLVNIKSHNKEWNQLFTLFQQYEYAEITLYAEPENIPDRSPQEIWETLISPVRSNVSRKEYIQKNVRQYQLYWHKNLHLISETDKNYLFLSCSRKRIYLSPEQCFIYEAFESNDTQHLSLISMTALEEFISICYLENEKNMLFERLIDSRCAEITNLNQVILSFLGSRKCNMDCRYCFSDHSCMASASMPQEDMVKIADLLTGDIQNLDLHVDNNLGGEPLLDFENVKRRHETMLQYHKKRGIKASFGLLTNGTLLEKEHLKWLKSNIPYLGFSLDGDQETNDRIRLDRSQKGTYQKTTDAIRMLQEDDWPVETGVSCVITAYNTDIKGLHKHFREDLNISHVVMKPVRAAVTSDYALTYDNLEMLVQGYEDFFEFLYHEAKTGNLEPLYAMLQPLDYAGRFFMRIFLKDRVIVKRCGAGEHIFSVNDDGRVYPCDSFNGTEQACLADLQNGFHNPSHFQVPYVNKENPDFGCDECWARYLCGGICQYVQYLNQYKHNEVTKLECSLAKYLIQSAIVFWGRAEREWSPDLLEKVGGYIQHIGFSPMENPDSFVYAPC